MEKSEKRATNRDVAKFAGVSVATVSYVINGREDMRIPEATKKKVMQAVNILNYSPNPFAVQLKKTPSRSIVLRTGSSRGFFSDLETLFFSRDFNITVRQNNHTLSYLPDTTPEKLSGEACVCFDMTREEFHALGQENFIPLIAVDCLIDDSIFYQVTPRYEKIKAAGDAYFNAPYTYVAVMPADTNLHERITKIFPDTVFVSDLKHVQAISSHGKNILLTQPSLFEVFASTNTNYNVFCYDAHLIARSQIIFNCVKNAINRIKVEDTAHFIEI